MSKFQFFNRLLPQTLLTASLLMYFTIAFDFLFGRVRYPVIGVITLAFLVGVLGIANERRFGYYIAVTAAGANVLREITWLVLGWSPSSILGLIFSGALLALLLHPMSREHQRIWFR